MGVNMPARTVVFDSTQKHDGNKLRDLYPGGRDKLSCDSIQYLDALYCTYIITWSHDFLLYLHHWSCDLPVI